MLRLLKSKISDWHLRWKIIKALMPPERHTIIPIASWWEVSGRSALEQFKETYRTTKHTVTRLCGEPIYDGDGPAVLAHVTEDGVEVPHRYAGPNLERACLHFRNTVELSCWNKGSRMLALIVTSHDAHTLHNLQLEIFDKPRTP